MLSWAIAREAHDRSLLWDQEIGGRSSGAVAGWLSSASGAALAARWIAVERGIAMAIVGAFIGVPWQPQTWNIGVQPCSLQPCESSSPKGGVAW